MKVLLGMSGGVDSSTAALLLRQQGHEVKGLSLRLFENRQGGQPGSCCSREAMADAAQAAGAAGIAHSTVDARDIFVTKVVEPFARAYTQGLTPNPCVLCNRHVKFPLLVKHARETGMDLIATGHYAIADHRDNLHTLKQGVDKKKDQSYFLYPIGLETLKMCIFPLGERTKDEIRAIAQEAGLDSSKRPESQEICFVENDDYAATVCSLFPDAAKPGPIIGPGGKKMGTHRGTLNYTIGQRRGLGVSWPEPLYVTAMDTATNTVYLGPKSEVMISEFTAEDLLWLTSPPAPGERMRYNVKMRSTMQAMPAEVEVMDGGLVQVRYDEPEFAPAPGQSAVLHDGPQVLGGGIIKSLKTPGPA